MLLCSFRVAFDKPQINLTFIVYLTMKLLKDPCIYLDSILIMECLIVNGVTHIIKYAGVELIFLSLFAVAYMSTTSSASTPAPRPPTSTTSESQSLFGEEVESIPVENLQQQGTKRRTTSDV